MPARARGGAVPGRLAPLALMPGAAFAVHQLRFLLAFREAAFELQRQGHSYLHSLVPWIVLGIAFVVGAFLRALGRALGGRCSLPRYTLSFAALWLACSTCLILLYAAQEVLEGQFATGHPGGVSGVFGHGGWWSIPAAIAVGMVLAAAFTGAHWVLHEVAQRRRRALAVTQEPVATVWPPREIVVLRLAPLADGSSGRGPPR
ncbi:MAG TPA: hypothetical protein VG388_04230 [Solirubrobacteraceae bacterium]|nr:hypothetical protein [Solirubrobacteraceae bacterium]